MKNPPDFVMYVVMLKKPGSKKFDPVWQCLGVEDFAQGYRRRRDAIAYLRIWQEAYGEKNAYLQQYGPYS